MENEIFEKMVEWFRQDIEDAMCFCDAYLTCSQVESLARKRASNLKEYMYSGGKYEQQSP